ncbi:MAG: VWA domain-containing protein [Candidatus Thiodiazotropha lotti]|nr:VWA domain-containing protein [Candidatus Thiodiazotropha lotti]MCG8005219.1 VWA domain-containing protein [Candidatus Thiodiazotropha lotti]MCG8006946.1 VWA domain-containing protein [Candidatus Thiodiazotropha lotti]MCW4188846.1 VWA domain-containing protein [Candidatus Thiodiazotropha lotti]MCW4194528.1 VWA domain-containing protein [Candidatus Thiodiazotropha lotti]
MSKQIAILLDNSGSMFHPVGGNNDNTKIYEAARGGEFFIENLIDELTANPDSEFAISVHRFASNYQLLPGGAQIDSSQAGFETSLATMQSSIAAIEDQTASSATVGVMTDLYDGIRRVADYLNNPANQPGFGAPDSKVIFVFTDGIQTISHGGTSMADYEADEGVVFSNLLDASGIKLVAWGTGSDALGAVLAELVDQALAGGENPISTSKVLFPIDEAGIFENCTAEIASNAIYIVSNNGVLPLAPAGETPTRLLWEQFSLPLRRPRSVDDINIVSVAHTSRLINHKDFEVIVDGSSKELILVLVAHTRRVAPSIVAVSPSGGEFDQNSNGARSFRVENAWALKIPNPEQGTWRVRVHGDRKLQPMVMDLMARGVQKRFGFEVSAKPRHIPHPAKVTINAIPRWDGKPAEGKFQVSAHIMGSGSVNLERQDDGSFTSEVEISRPGISIIPVEISGELSATGKSIGRIAYAIVLLGKARDPRFSVIPDTYEQGKEYTVTLTLDDAIFKRYSQVRFGDDIQVSNFKMLNSSTARAVISVKPHAIPGEREVVTYNPQAESIHPVRIVESKDGKQIPGRICCLRFNASGQLVGIVLCDGTRICIKLYDDRIQKLLELARDKNLSVSIHVDEQGCLADIEICR